MQTRPEIVIIAEVKTESPFGFKSDLSWDQLFRLAETVGDMISVHTDKRWGGSFDLIDKAKRLTDKPILAKGIHRTDGEIERALECGANFVLVVGRLPGVHREKCMVEPQSLAELKLIPKAVKTVWNSRNLSDGSLKKETFKQAREIFNGWLCQASNIKTVRDIDGGADAVLVGANLATFAESLIW
ncbi:MAG: Indole-3-glycerol phosphate synthase [Candidatus Parcubacteria bacterium]|jgi:indole-3-glycerol phosphate synthase|nr:Indole-3-glycerol phosphate synthase [Candidatus Parcubacteria bacterium]